MTRVVRQLVAAGHQVKAIVRRPDQAQGLVAQTPYHPDPLLASRLSESQ